MYKTYISTKLIFKCGLSLLIFMNNFNVIFDKKKAVLLSIQSHKVFIVYSSKVISYILIFFIVVMATVS